jgi:hypothetical protein
MSDATADLVRRVRTPDNKFLASPEAEYQQTMRVLLVIVLGLAAVLAVGLVMQMFGEQGLSNSYAVLADAFLHGHLDVSQCVDIDCAQYQDKYYVVFPPGPAILAMPFVAVFGVSFAGFIALATALSGMSLFVWWRILAALRVERTTAVWILIDLAVGTPLYYITIRGDGVWFLAQACGFLAVSAALWAALQRKSLWLVGLFLALAFLSRQMTILIAPFIYAASLRDSEPLISIKPERLFGIVRFLTPLLIALIAYMAYNYARFGAPLDTGYAYIGTDTSERTILFYRVQDFGLFSPEYFLFNLFHLLFQGFHADFVGPYATELGGMDRMGTSILAASPFVLLAVFTKWRRTLVIGALCALAMIVPMLFYHSNGLTQYNVQRYVLDWLPIVLFALAGTIRGGLRPAFAVLVTYAVGLNVVTSVVAYLTT